MADVSVYAVIVRRFERNTELRRWRGGIGRVMATHEADCNGWQRMVLFAFER
jgi:hypothetical protein